MCQLECAHGDIVQEKTREHRRKSVRQMRLKAGMSVGDLVDEMGGAGVIGAGRVAKGVEILTEMLGDPDYTVFLSISGPLVPSGLRLLFTELLRRDLVDVIVTNGANMVHDLIEAMGKHHLIGSLDEDDRELWKKGINRAYDIYVESSSFAQLERRLWKMLDEMPESHRVGVPIHQFLHEIGLRLTDEDSILRNAALKGIPIFSPGLLDSMLGIPLWMYSTRGKLELDPLKDFETLARLVYDAKKAGAIILGGGTPKHHTLYVNTLREGLDSAIQISTAIADDGSLSGAPLSEAISWGKIKGDKMVNILGDVTIIFPLMVAAAFEKLSVR